MKKTLSTLLVTSLIIGMTGFSAPAEADGADIARAVSATNKTIKDNSSGRQIKGEVLVALALGKGDKSPLLKKGTLSNDPRIMIRDVMDFGGADVLSTNKKSKKALKDKTLKIVHVKSTVLDTKRLKKALSGYKCVNMVVANYKKQKCSAPNDPLFNDQWYLGGAKYFISGSYACADAAIGYTPEEPADKDTPIVAIIDDGVDFTNEDLKNKMWKNPYKKLEGLYGYDCVNDDNDPDPNKDENHGTMIAGLIAAETNNGVGIAGVSGNAKIMSLRQFDYNNELNGSMDAEMKAFEYIYKAQKLGANVKAVNCSFGYEPMIEPDSEMKEIIKLENAAIKRVGKMGAVTVFAAGNNSEDVDIYKYAAPHALDKTYMLLVGATNFLGEVATYSNYGKKHVDIFAPGSAMLTTDMADHFTPFLYDESKRASLCRVYESFDDNRTGFITYDELTGKNTGALTLTHCDKDFYGKSDSGCMEIKFNRIRTSSKYAYTIFYDVTDCQLEKLDDIFISMATSDDTINKDEWDVVPGYVPRSMPLGLFSLGKKVYFTIDLKSMWGEVNSCIGKSIYIDNFSLSVPCKDDSIFGKYIFAAGTSFSAPIVCGAIARIAQQHPEMNAKQLRKALMSCVKKLPALEDKCISGGTLDLSLIGSL